MSLAVGGPGFDGGLHPRNKLHPEAKVGYSTVSPTGDVCPNKEEGKKGEEGEQIRKKLHTKTNGDVYSPSCTSQAPACRRVEMTVGGPGHYRSRFNVRFISDSRSESMRAT